MRPSSLLLALCLLFLGPTSVTVVPAHASTSHHSARHSHDDNDAPVSRHKLKHPVLWHDPGDVRAKDLYDGAGGKSGHPHAPFVFESEDKKGTNPKFDVKDANGDKWRVKLGDEARPEVVASRLLWAVGYYVNDDYLEPQATVPGLHLSRGEDRIGPGGHIENARFARKPPHEKKIGIWRWKSNPFTGKRDFNGLRVMMAVMNNWDLKDVNNAVYEDKDNHLQLFLVSDVGATFGANGVGWSHARDRGNINSFRESKFIQRLDARTVDFYTPRKPTGLLIGSLGLAAKEYHMRAGLDWIGNNIPRSDARWMGQMLGQLSHKQLVDAFRAGNFPPGQIDAFVEVVESRIAELKHL